MAPKILVVLTSHNKLGSLDKPTGWFLPEFSHPYDVLSAKNAEFTVVSPKGGEAPLDPASVEFSKGDAGALDFHENKKSLWQNTQTISSVLGRINEFDAVFYPGGHGPVFDLVTDKDSIQLIQDFWTAGKPVAAVCHGPVVLVNVKDASGEPLVKGKTVTGFSDAEEEAAQLTAAVPLLLETELVKKGAKFEKAPELFGAKVVVDGKLITGQNPASAKGVGEALVAALGL